MGRLEAGRFEQLAGLPFFDWASTRGVTRFLGDGCDLWFRDGRGMRRRLVGLADGVERTS
jgi:hypothetical protein